MRTTMLALAALLVAIGLGFGCEKDSDKDRPDDPSGRGGVPDSLVLARVFPPLPASGEDEVAVYATVVDAGGRGLKDIGVRFTTSHGAIGPFATTDTRGVAQTTLTSAASTEDLLATVTARAAADTSASALSASAPAGMGGGAEERSGDRGAALDRAGRASEPDAAAAQVVLSRKPVDPEALALLRAAEGGGVPALPLQTGSWVTVADQAVVPMTGLTLAVTAQPATIPADGMSESRVVASLLETTRRVPLPGRDVRFGATAGVIAGRVRTDDSGLAAAALTAAPGESGAEVTAYFGPELHASTAVAFSALMLELSAGTATLFADGQAQTPIRASLRTAENNPVPGARIDFATTLGTIPSPGTTGADGVATAMLTAGEATGRALVTARFGRAPARSLEIDFVAPPETATLLLAADPPALPADGASRSTITATALDAGGDPMPDGTVVDFSIVSGSGQLISPAAMTEGGAARTTFVAGAIAGPTRVLASSGAAEGLVTLPLTPSGVGGIALSADRASILADGIELATLTAVVIDALGNPVAPGTTVQFATSLGALEQAQPTDGAGVATVRLRAERFVTGTARVTAAAGGFQAMADVACVSEEAAHIVAVSVEPPVIGVRGPGDAETATIVFEVRDRNGIPVDQGNGVTVAFEILAGGTDAAVHPASVWTNARGRAAATVSAGTISGTVEVRATSAALASEPIRVSIHGGLPDADHFAIAFEKVNVAGLVYAGLEDRVTAYVGDRYGNPVPLGTRVWFQAEFGLVQGSDDTDELGEAAVTAVTAAPFPPIPGGDGLVRITAQTVGSEGEDLIAYGHILWSGPTILEILSPASLDIPNGGSAYVEYRVRDANFNPLTAGTAITVAATAGTLVGDVNIILPDAQSSAYTTFTAVLVDDDPATDEARPVWVTIQVASQNGNRSALLGGTIR